MPVKIPQYHEFMNPTIKALQALGGSASVTELNDRVIGDMKLSDEVLEVRQGKGNQTVVSYRLAWARSYLKIYGAIENSTRAVWSLTSEYINVDHIDVNEVIRFERSRRADRLAEEKGETEVSIDRIVEEEIKEPAWRARLRQILFSLTPDTFERLTQRILRESGFTQVEVTGKSGDGGIDGKGILRLNGLMSFHMLFQCKRYQGSVGSDSIRNFRGAMQGRVDKGLFITTGTFTREAEKEAKRDGAPPIELVDGEDLMDMLKELGMGLKPVMDYEVVEDWFRQI